MHDNASALLTPWANFYIMTGSSAAALTGLMFVVITLVSGTERLRRSPDGISTFSTPTVLHFSAALLISAMFSAPWRLIVHPAFLLAAAGLFGVCYILRVVWMQRHLQTYHPDTEDWVWYNILPFLAYVTLLGGAIALFSVPVTALFVIAAGMLLLIFIGIRNSWDIVTFLAIHDRFGTSENDVPS